MRRFCSRIESTVLPLRIGAEGAHVDVRLLEIRRHVHAADGYQRGRKRQFSKDDLPQLTLENFTHPFDSVFHGNFGVGEPTAFRRLV